jgi:hypothetical protein
MARCCWENIAQTGQTVAKLQWQELYCYHMKMLCPLIDFLEENDGVKNRHSVSLQAFEENIVFISNAFPESLGW